MLSMLYTIECDSVDGSADRSILYTTCHSLELFCLAELFYVPTRFRSRVGLFLLLFLVVSDDRFDEINGMTHSHGCNAYTSSFL